MPILRYKKGITPMDVFEVLKDKVKPSDITVEEDGDEIRIIIRAELSQTDIDNLDRMMKLFRRI